MNKFFAYLIALLLVAGVAWAQTPENPTSHDGVGTTWYLHADMVTETNLDDCAYRTKLTEGGTWSGWTTWDGVTQIGLNIPAEEEDWYIEVECTDLAGRTGDDTLMVAYAEEAGDVVLLGYDVVGNSSEGINSARIYYYEDSYSSPTGDPALESGTGNTVYVYITGSVPSSRTLYAYVALDSNRSVLGWGSVTINDSDINSWVAVPLSSGVSITKGTRYLLGVAFSVGTNIGAESERVGTSVVSYTDAIGDLTDVETVPARASSGVSGPVSVYLK